MPPSEEGANLARRRGALLRVCFGEEAPSRLVEFFRVMRRMQDFSHDSLAVDAF